MHPNALENKLEKLRRRASQVLFAKIHFWKIHFQKIHFWEIPFRKLHFRKILFWKIHFREIHFRKIHFQKKHFRKIHFRKIHFCKILMILSPCPNCSQRLSLHLNLLTIGEYFRVHRLLFKHSFMLSPFNHVVMNMNEKLKFSKEIFKFKKAHTKTLVFKNISLLKKVFFSGCGDKPSNIFF